MTLEQLQQIVLRLSNQFFLKYWIHANYPITQPWQMSIMIMGRLIPLSLGKELKAKGFSEYIGEDFVTFTIDRTNEDGTPYTG